MKGQVQSIFFAVLIAAFVATLVPLSAPAAQVRQCSAAVPKSAKGHWSWRMIDGRKCWYSGKAVISRSSLRWPAAAPAQAKAEAAAKAAAAATVTVSVATRSDPMDAQAQMSDDDSFESRWQLRVVSR
ncbi:hypothetical protein ACH79_12830 [Bradyrhizobium sp. CCBAU 051011]|jgi:hypothetical protein|uniref:hypothetical protein n=1 Tax=Bradyrhizobium sp. CCBAU 051011 TaxID=858422 RepID=UPI001373B7A2|nr:hypothetical protein [Bradyrhizobium sp. CCBAU 051011]QHO73409.1 hypothetical protein ACH79_12830 [Bradyrhizobium sp. CCBAU 051011]